MLIRTLCLLTVLTGCVASLAAPPEAPKPARDKALECKDGAKIFGAEAWKKLQPAVDRLYKEKATDFLIETMEVPPKSTPAKVKAMKPEEKEKFFHELVLERVKAEKIQGMYILICKSPTYLYVGTTGDANFPTVSASKIRESLLMSMQEKKFNDGLGIVIQMALDSKGLGEKK